MTVLQDRANVLLQTKQSELAIKNSAWHFTCIVE